MISQILNLGIIQEEFKDTKNVSIKSNNDRRSLQKKKDKIILIYKTLDRKKQRIEQHKPHNNNKNGDKTQVLRKGRGFCFTSDTRCSKIQRIIRTTTSE